MPAMHPSQPAVCKGSTCATAAPRNRVLGDYAPHMACPPAKVAHLRTARAICHPKDTYRQPGTAATSLASNPSKHALEAEGVDSTACEPMQSSIQRELSSRYRALLQGPRGAQGAYVRNHTSLSMV